ncbi:MAG: HEAT repeat domain-containing protein [Gemmataceae bacterium]
MRKFLLVAVFGMVNGVGIPSMQAADAPTIITMRTAGQGERKVQVLRTDRTPEGQLATTVKDLQTGEIFMMFDKVLNGPVESVAQKLAATAPPTAPVIDITMPKAKAPPGTGMAERFGAPMTNGANLAKTPPGQKPSFFARVMTGQTEATAPAYNSYSAPKPPAPQAAKSGFGSLFNTNPGPTVASRIGLTKPKLPTNVSNTATTTASAPVVASPAVKPVTVARPVEPRQMVAEAPPQIQAPVATPAVAVVEENMMPMAVPVGMTTPETIMQEELSSALYDLQTSKRPSIRYEAITVLAEGRYGSREEIKRLILESAKSDRSPLVRAYCVNCLSKLGYMDREFVDLVNSQLETTEPALRRACEAAQAKFVGR